MWMVWVSGSKPNSTADYVGQVSIQMLLTKQSDSF